MQREMAQRPRPKNRKKRMVKRRRSIHLRHARKDWLKVVSNFKDAYPLRKTSELDQKPILLELER